MASRQFCGRYIRSIVNMLSQTFVLMTSGPRCYEDRPCHVQSSPVQMQIPLSVPGLLSAPQYENYEGLVVDRIPDSSCGCVSNKLNWGRKWCYDSAAGAGRNQPDEDYCRLFAAVFWPGSSWSRVELETKVHPKVLEDFTITEKATTRAFSWLKATTSLSYLRYYAKWMLTPR